VTEHHNPAFDDPALRTKAIESLLIEKGYLTQDAIDYVVRAYESEIGPLRGAQIVARAWVDPAFRQRLLLDATAAARELGVEGFAGESVVAVENTDGVHNIVVCTLCSCYPWAILGIPPTWYKSPEYRARTVREPRAVLREFGVELAPGMAIKVWDSSADLRYMVVPRRPVGTESWSEKQLAAIVTRDAMIGTGVAQVPAG
jgi:nitrile hydratase